jgi:hypothetical protein
MRLGRIVGARGVGGGSRVLQKGGEGDYRNQMKGGGTHTDAFFAGQWRNQPFRQGTQNGGYFDE